MPDPTIISRIIILLIVDPSITTTRNTFSFLLANYATPFPFRLCTALLGLFVNKKTPQHSGVIN